MRRSTIGPVAAAALVAILSAGAARGADDAGAPAGAAVPPIVSVAPEAPAPDPGATEERKAKAAAAAKPREQGPGPAIEKAAQETGHALDRGTKDFRDGAENFFKDVGRFFSGGK
jgi:hypothetical protein